MGNTRFPPPTGVLADMLLALTHIRATMDRVGRMCKSLPDSDEFHEARHEANIIVLRLAKLESMVLRWPRMH